MAHDQNPYQAYTDGSIFSDNPLNLVIALYQGALDATRQAESAVRARDIQGRTKAINKAISILTELLVTLDHKRGGEISQNLKRLYSYMQQRLLTAHMRQVPEPIAEVAKLLTTLLEGWRAAGAAQLFEATAFAVLEQSAAASQLPASTYVSAPVYGGYAGGYGEDSFASRSGTAYSF